MARKNRDQAKDKDINRKFEKQQRQLNRKRVRNAIGGIIFLVIIVLALQFTPYRNIHLDIIDAAKGLLKSLTSGKSAPVERDPKYW